MKTKKHLCKNCGHILEEEYDFCNIYCARSYEKKQLKAEKIQEKKKARKIASVKDRILGQIFDEYSREEMLFALMGFSDIEVIKNAIGKKVQKLQNKIEEIKNSTAVDSVNEN